LFLFTDALLFSLSEDPSVTVLLLERGKTNRFLLAFHLIKKIILGGTPTQQEELLKLVPRYQWEQAVTNPIYAEVISSDPHPDMIDRRTIYYEGRSFGYLIYFIFKKIFISSKHSFIFKKRDNQHLWRHSCPTQFERICCMECQLGTR